MVAKTRIADKSKLIMRPLSLSLPASMVADIDSSIKARPYKISRNLWITNACARRLALAHKAGAMLKFYIPDLHTVKLHDLAVRLPDDIVNQIDDITNSIPYKISRNIWVFNACLGYLKLNKNLP